MDEVVQPVVNMLEHEIDKGDITVEFENNLPTGATFLVDKMRTQQVLLNMLTYTVKNAPHGARVKFFLTPKHRVRKEKEGQNIKVYIAVGVVDEFHRRQQSGPHTID
jgi:signal transduction histidine kinase